MEKVNGVENVLDNGEVVLDMAELYGIDTYSYIDEKLSEGESVKEGALEEGEEQLETKMPRSSIEWRVVRTGPLNVRSGPGTNNPVVSQLGVGLVRAIWLSNLTTANGLLWGNIQNTSQWIALTHTGPARSVSGNQSSNARPGVGLSLNLRQGPGTSFPITGSLLHCRSLQVTHIAGNNGGNLNGNNNYNWGLTTFNGGVQRWVSLRYTGSC